MPFGFPHTIWENEQIVIIFRLFNYRQLPPSTQATSTEHDHCSLFYWRVGKLVIFTESMYCTKFSGFPLWLQAQNFPRTTISYMKILHLSVTLSVPLSHTHFQLRELNPYESSPCQTRKEPCLMPCTLGHNRLRINDNFTFIKLEVNAYWFGIQDICICICTVLTMYQSDLECIYSFHQAIICPDSSVWHYPLFCE